MRRNFLILKLALIVLVFIKPISVDAQSGTYGNTYIFGGNEMVVFNNNIFQNSGNGVLQGIVGTARNTPRGYLSFYTAGMATGASNNAHVDGYVKYYGTSSFIFPIGDNGVYAPLKITTANSASPAEAAYYNVNPSMAITSSVAGGNEVVLPSGGPFSTNNFQTAIDSISTIEYWDVNGVEATKISLSWRSTSGLNGMTASNATRLTIVGWNSTTSKWEIIPSTIDATSIYGTSSNISNTGSITSDNTIFPNAYQVYSLASLDDTDGDGVPDISDTDDDNDGISDAIEASAIGGPDTDGDGIPNSLDLDSDNDGINDITESGTTGDTNGDGYINGSEVGVAGSNFTAPYNGPATTTGTDVDGDGILSSADGAPTLWGDSKDTDGDGISDNIDTDDDNDSISDAIEASANGGPDTDGDGVPNNLDLDSDNDGINDIEESGTTGDTNGDGYINGSEVAVSGSNFTAPYNGPATTTGSDVDGDGIFSSADGAPTVWGDALDTDGDGTPDTADTDDDNDGLADINDPLPLDTDNDGTPNVTDTDDDGDGIADTSEAIGQSLDTDNDGNPNVTDIDDDNDGIADTVEQGTCALICTLPDTDGDGIPDLADALDTDGDGTPDTADTDDDNDGLADINDPLPLDTDNDGTPNATDTDDDGDGIADTSEAIGQSLDTDNDGNPNVTDIDDDNDGIADTVEQGTCALICTLPDTDGDGLPDLADVLDTDGDGTPDTADTDDDNDGLADINDPLPLDTDNDGTPNATDTDDDGDGIADTAEAPGKSLDTDNDGIPNVTDTDDDNDGIADTVEQGICALICTLPDTDGDGLPDLADVLDTDGDGTPDTADTDDDNDGLADINDPLPLDTDNDGTPNATDADDDGDGIADTAEAPGKSLDTDNDGIPNVTDTDDDNDGIADTVEQGTCALICTLPDTDGDGLPNLADPLDTDGDGIPNGIDTDDDNDGISDAIEASANGGPDTDGDGVPNNLDLDSDNDGVNDIVESGTAGDTNGDGYINGSEVAVSGSNFTAPYNGPATTSGTDLDGDGILSSMDGLPNTWGDAIICINMAIKVMLEGPYIENGSNGLTMSTKLNTLGYLPGQFPSTFFGIATPVGQPYSGSPWNYSGAEGSGFVYTPSVPATYFAGYPATATDWVLVSLRASSASNTTLCTKAALLLSNGTIQMISGFDCCELDLNQTYYVVIEHRNHLIVMSHQEVAIVNNTITYDFTSQQSYKGLLGFGQKFINGKYVMFTSNGQQVISTSADTDINVNDKDLWLLQNGLNSSYYLNDFDLNGDTNVQDKSAWLLNNGKFSDVPRN